MMKRTGIIALVVAAMLISCLTGCGKSKSDAETAARPGEALAGTVTGQIISISGDSVTLRLGTLTKSGTEACPGERPTPPEGGSGEMPTPPEGGSGEMPTPPEDGTGGRPGDMGFTPGEETLTLPLTEEQLAGLKVGDVVTVTRDEKGKVTALKRVEPGMPGSGDFPPGGGPGEPGGMEGRPGAETDIGGSAETLTEDGSFADAAYSSDRADENALRVDGAVVSLTNPTLNKSGDSSNTEASDFYGGNAGLLVRNGAAVTVVGGRAETSAAGGNALFCYGTGTTLTVKDMVIRTEANNSGGIQTAGGGTTVAENLDVETIGASAAAIRSDRGGGTVRVTRGSYVTHGTGSPAIYSTAAISVTDATLTSTASEAVVVEGRNSVALTDCTVTGNMRGTYHGDAEENLQTVMIYQSMSGDAAMGGASFSMTGGSLTGQNGDLFYVTNTAAAIALTNVALELSNGILLRVAGNNGARGWGKAGENGGTVTMTAEKQQLTGTILVDEISSLDLRLKESSAWEGTVNPDGPAGTVCLTLDEGCTWKLTGDAWLTEFHGDVSAVTSNGFHVYVDGTPIV